VSSRELGLTFGYITAVPDLLGFGSVVLNTFFSSCYVTKVLLLTFLTGMLRGLTMGGLELATAACLAAFFLFLAFT